MAIAKTFQNPEVRKISRLLRKKLSEIAPTLLAHERYNLADQIRAGAISLTSIIAEGFGRFHCKENVQICRIARGCPCEARDHFLTRLDQRNITTGWHQELNQELTTFMRVLNAYFNAIGFTKTLLDSE